jgi:hypothetical protein
VISHSLKQGRQWITKMKNKQRIAIKHGQQKGQVEHNLPQTKGKEINPQCGNPSK